MKLKNPEVLEDYIVSYHKNATGDKRHYSHAKLNIGGYIIVLSSNYYPSMDAAVAGIKERITKAVIDFNDHVKASQN